jgi:hypothetical protein
MKCVELAELSEDGAEKRAGMAPSEFGRDSLAEKSAIDLRHCVGDSKVVTVGARNAKVKAVKGK